MKYYRITKYDPQNRNPNGDYLADEWTSYSDIGKTFQGKVLTSDDYIAVEKSYISVLQMLSKALGIRTFRIVQYEDYGAGKWADDKLNIDQLVPFAQDCLREKCWGKIQHKKLQIHFGYDYYMYVGTNLKSEEVFAIANTNHLYCEAFKSPYN